MNHEELEGWLRLQCTPGVGNAGARKLLTAFATPRGIFRQPVSALRDHVPLATAQALQSDPPDFGAALAATRRWLDTAPGTRHVLACNASAYPQALLQIADPPVLLYGMGPEEVWRDNRLNHASLTCVALVGSRNPTAQGADNARHFARALAQAGVTVVSGLALGIDGMAHEGALDCGDDMPLPTIAVVGTGLDRVYPRQHQQLSHRIAARGILLSEYALGTTAMACNFPRRNRLIAGLSVGTVVVEAALKSGSLITAQLALEQGREVFAIPGSIHSVQSRGCHALIRQGATLVESVQDILLELPRWKGPACPAAPAPAEPLPAGPESALLRALGFDPVRLDLLQERTGLSTAALQAQLMELELQGDVRRLPGGVFQRLVCA